MNKDQLKIISSLKIDDVEREIYTIEVHVPRLAVKTIYDLFKKSRYSKDLKDDSPAIVAEAMSAFVSVVLAGSMAFLSFDKTGFPYIDKEKVPADHEAYIQDRLDKFLDNFTPEDTAN
jgi:hypothetical protein